ncbi:cation:dicarboxylase symporter family transporter [Streptomyces sp. NPDC006172]|uniref:cation:dicarboxylate symporter family transporter n=1 Tax=Streptomyces sp. NPDC006172 TaxID=3154470 RepID=UPI0033E9EED9
MPRRSEFLTDIVPNSFFGPFVEGNILQVIFLAVVFGIAIKLVGKTGEPIVTAVGRLTAVVFKVLSSPGPGWPAAAAPWSPPSSRPPTSTWRWSACPPI